MKVINIKRAINTRLVMREAQYKDTVRAYNRGYISLDVVDTERNRLNFWLNLADRHNIRA